MLDLPVPAPGPPGPFGTMAWLRATVSRFANGEPHARRRGLIEARLAALDPHALATAATRAAATPATIAAAPPAAATPPATGASPPPAAGSALAGVPREYLPVAVLAHATGVIDPVAAVTHTRAVAAAYHPGTDASGADDALDALLALFPPDEPEALAQHVAILVQACEATAGLIRGDNLPVKTTKRVTPDGEIVLVDLSGRPFGEGPRRCPGEAHARAFAEALR
ncbi:hypothetical protein DVA67_018720 [Solirubrobacter sp. CPCC 204708]|uniref:DUF222 domain-containing protein n=1 Tax=Solirubrobacter deserti TaxID=2282478 RepID=A0ABT4RN20_9ACTN|nr:hypothetical protein [Solirubrobacter deserti]MBE2318022.1 hypothetical protein [Solirubrobacter deserti]MDA0139701.1 hypothetical protein [Solirubrobacter deserti]